MKHVLGVYVCAHISLLFCVYVFVHRTGLVFISIGNNKVSDSVDDMHSLSVTVVHDSSNFINDIVTVRIIHTHTRVCIYKRAYTLSKESLGF